MNSIQDDITNSIKTSLSRYESNIFEDLQRVFESYFDKPCSNMIELRKKSQKVKGTSFEIFCKMFLIEKGYDCWLLNELDEKTLELLNLSRQDVGIDLIAKKENRYYPVQCKFRKPTRDVKGRSVHRVTWRDLSTFLSLCVRTGGADGWKRHIIMTNADYCCWKGKKSPLDFTIGKKTFQNTDRQFWYNMVYKKTEQEPVQTRISATASAKELRSKWLDNISAKTNSTPK